MADSFARCEAAGGQSKTMKPITINVVGIPAPGGSKKFVGFSKQHGRAILVDAGGKRNKVWRRQVAEAGVAIMWRDLKGLPLECALRVEFLFKVPRAQWHRNSKGFLVPKAPLWPITRPDVLKLTRSTEDALTGAIWKDDAQIVQQFAEKRFAGVGEAPGVCIIVTCLEQQNNEPA